MSANTKIEWCDHSWSPWEGCTKVSPGCAHCYAERQSKRNPAVLGQWGKGVPRVLAKNWGDPVKWNDWSNRICNDFKRISVFPSMCDWLDDEVSIEWLADFLRLIRETPNLDWLLLTKRPENWRDRIEKALHVCDRETAVWLDSWLDCLDMPERGDCPQNIWIGTSVEDQTRADERIPELLKIPARLRFLSVEPLLGPVDLRLTNRAFCFPCHITTKGNAVGMPQGIHWVIVGGESGPKSRPCNVDWIRFIVRQCKTAGVPCFVKQLGADVVDERANSADFVPGKECWPEGAAVDGCRVILKHPKGGDPSDWPEDLRVRQFPEVKP